VSEKVFPPATCVCFQSIDTVSYTYIITSKWRGKKDRELLTL